MPRLNMGTIAPLLVAALFCLPAPGHAQYRGGSDPGLSRFRESTDPRRFGPQVISPGSRIGPRADGTHVRVLQGQGTRPPLDATAPGTLPDLPRTAVGEVQAQPAAEVLLPNGFRDQGRILAPTSHLQRFPPPPNQPSFPPQFTVSFPSRRDGFYAPNLIRDQAGNSALRTLSNRLEERNAFQK
ncbi:MAG: hypothetical protein HY303_10150 [Candidatus Wallbacteria bacterium]|nr:hypothetical protein [Candidatus Wallbacteria bacterium]